MKPLLSVTLLFVALAGCGYTTVSDYGNLSDEALMTAYKEAQAEEAAARMEVDAEAASGRPLRTSLAESRIADAEKRQAKIYLEIRRRRLQVPDEKPAQD
jgi:hypothetical protein